MTDREALLSRMFVEMADTLVADFDLVDVLTTIASRCTQLFEVDEAGIMLAVNGQLQVAASSSQAMRLLELFEVQHDEGPSVDCLRGGIPIGCEQLSTAADRWPAFTMEALHAGIGSVFALPMRLRERTIGSLNLLRHRTGSMSTADLTTAQALADVATIGILQHRIAAESQLLAEQLQGARQSRVVIEQAKGVVAATTGVRVEDAFDLMRNYSRVHKLRLADMAAGIVAREFPPGLLVERPTSKGP